MRPLRPHPQQSLLARIRQPGLVVAPGVLDMVSLRLADTFGFDALYMTGYGTVASHMGLPDAGLATYSDMVGRVTAMAGMARTPVLTWAELESFGYKIAIFPVTALLSAVQAMAGVYQALKAQGSYASITLPLHDFADLTKLMGFEDVCAFEKRYGRWSRPQASGPSDRSSQFWFHAVRQGQVPSTSN